MRIVTLLVFLLFFLLAAATSWAQPVITISPPSPMITNTGPVTYTVTYSMGTTVILFTDVDISLNPTGSADGVATVSGGMGFIRTVEVSSISGDGTLSITIGAGTATDGSNSAATATSTTFTVDNTAPTITNTAPSMSTSVNHAQVSYTLSEDIASGTITWTQTSGTADSGSPHAQALAGSELATGPHSNISLTNAPTLVDGSVYTISFAATDAAGNMSSSTQVQDVTYDTSPPTITNTAPTMSTSVNHAQVSYTLSEDIASGTITWTQTSGTADSGSPHVQALAGSELATGLHSNIPLTNAPTLVDGSVYTISFAATDAAGNMSSSTQVQDVTYDTSPPTITNTAPTMSTSVNHAQVSYTLSEDIASGTITWTQTSGTADSGSPHAQALAGSELATGAHSNIPLTNAPTLVDGSVYTISFAATDAAGNMSSSTQVQDVTYDTSPPTITIGAPPTITGSGPVIYIVTYMDATSTTLVFGDITLIPTGNATGTISLSGSGNVRTVTINTISGDGTLAISIDSGTASDGAGNSAAAATSTAFTVDNTDPTVVISSDDSNAIVKDADAVIITATFTDSNPIAESPSPEPTITIGYFSGNSVHD